MTKLIIFDLDGTLINSIYDLADSVNVVLTKYNLETHCTDKYYRFVGDGTLKLIERALPEEYRTEEFIYKVHAEFLEYYDNNCLNKTKIYDGILELIASLSKVNIKLAIASNKTDIFTKKIATYLFGKNVFDLVQGKLDGVPKKPNPEIVLTIMDKLKVSNDETIYVGDSDVDVFTAHNAGIKMCGCVWGFRGEKELKQSGADYILNKPLDLIDVINQKII